MIGERAAAGHGAGLDALLPLLRLVHAAPLWPLPLLPVGRPEVVEPLRDTETIRAALMGLHSLKRQDDEALAAFERLVGRLQAAKPDWCVNERCPWPECECMPPHVAIALEEAEGRRQAAEQEHEGRVLVGQVEWDALERRLERMAAIEQERDAWELACSAIEQRLIDAGARVVALETALYFYADADGAAVIRDRGARARAALSVSPAPSEPA